MMRNSGSPVQYLGIYVVLCAVTCVLALYGAVEHANLKAAEAAAAGDVATPGELQEISTPSQHDVGSNEEFEDDEDDAGKLPGIPDKGMDDKLRAVDVEMQRVLANADNDLTNFGRHITGWDEFRRKHAQIRRRLENAPKRNPFPNLRALSEGRSPKAPNKILLVTSTHPHECHNAHGDHILLQTLKNKVDYCRLHAAQFELYHNTDMLDEKMSGWWAKVFAMRMLLVARPDVEWLLWMDSDAVFTNMTFEFPLERYKDYNMVMHGRERKVYGQKSWLGLNTGVILLRNCQWSIDLLHAWARFSPKGPIREAAGALLTDAFPERPIGEAEDQCSLVYLLLTQRSRWGPKVFLEHSYHLQGFYEIMAMRTNRYPGMGDTWWPIITHFTGCQFCSGSINPIYTPESCHDYLQRGLAFANNQVLHNIGFTYAAPDSSSTVIKRIVAQTTIP